MDLQEIFQAFNVHLYCWAQKNHAVLHPVNHILPHPFTFPLPDLLINLSDLHCDIIHHHDRRLVLLCLLPPLCDCANREYLGWLGGLEWLSIVVVIWECAVKLFFSIPTKNRSKKKFPALRTNNSSLNKSYLPIPRDLHSSTDQLQSHLFKIENRPTCLYMD